jgi:hypothetical protein
MPRRSIRRQGRRPEHVEDHPRRTRQGVEFKDWADFQKRVKGVGDKRAAKLSEAGLQVNGKAKDGRPCGEA